MVKNQIRKRLSLLIGENGSKDTGKDKYSFALNSDTSILFSLEQKESDDPHSPYLPT